MQTSWQLNTTRAFKTQQTKKLLWQVYQHIHVSLDPTGLNYCSVSQSAQYFINFLLMTGRPYIA